MTFRRIIRTGFAREKRFASGSRCLLALLAMLALPLPGATAREPDRVFDLWPDLAPGETTRHPGTVLPTRSNEHPPATRRTDITQPQVLWFDPPVDLRTGTAVLIFPGGGYNYVVTDKEGVETAEWLNGLGIAAGVVQYRTKQKPPGDRPVWERPWQDGQRAVRLVRRHAKEWGVQADRIGVLGFSAGGNAAALVSTRFEEPAAPRVDETDDLSARPDFTLLIYPWRLTDESGTGLAEEVTVSNQTPPALLVHAHNDSVTPLNSIAYYSALKRAGVAAELHIYETGGHGYGLRPTANSSADTWPQRAAEWLIRRGWGR